RGTALLPPRPRLGAPSGARWPGPDSRGQPSRSTRPPSMPRVELGGRPPADGTTVLLHSPLARARMELGGRALAHVDNHPVQSHLPRRRERSGGPTQPRLRLAMTSDDLPVAGG